MVIGPQQAGEKNLRENARLLKKLEAMIDQALISDFQPGNLNGVCITPPEELYPGTVVYAELKRKYEEVGWKVDYEGDQRDGNYLRFTQIGGQR